MFNIKLGKFEFILLFIFAIGFITWIGYSIYSGTEPNVKIFIALWLIFAVVFISVFKKIMSDLYSKNFPYTYKEIRDNYGTPIETFKCPLVSVGDMRFRGFFAKFDIYNDCIVISSFGRCLVITDFNNLEINKVFFTFYLKAKVGDSQVKCVINKKQFILLDSKKIIQSELM